MMVVVLIVGLMVGVSAVRMDQMVPKYRLRGAARGVGALMTQARARAAATGKDVFFEVDLSKSRSWLLAAFPKPLEPGEDETKPRPLIYEQVLHQELPEDVQVVDVVLGPSERIENGRARVRLSPFGSSGHVIVNLKNKEDRWMSVRLNGFTGALSFADERRDAEELLEDDGR
jgi:hypothetical protein